MIYAEDMRRDAAGPIPLMTETQITGAIEIFPMLHLMSHTMAL